MALLAASLIMSEQQPCTTMRAQTNYVQSPVVLHAASVSLP